METFPLDLSETATGNWTFPPSSTWPNDLYFVPPEACGEPLSSCAETAFLGTIISNPASARSRSARLADLDLVLESPFIPPKG